ncbi:MAG: hypothetical protein V4574_13120 [Pseudomonadota bacterium]
MVIKLTAIPDELGVIRIACGGDTLEITVAQRSPVVGLQAGDSGGDIQTSGSGGGMQTYSSLFGNLMPGADRTPFDNPVIAAMPAMPEHGEGFFDVQAVMREVISGTAAGATGGVVLNTPGAVNLHQVSELGALMDQHDPGARLALDFGSTSSIDG